jgi:hypothetical protein
MTLSAIPAPLARFGRFLHRWKVATRQEMAAAPAPTLRHVRARGLPWHAGLGSMFASMFFLTIGVLAGAWLLPPGINGLLLLVLIVLVVKR